MLRGLISFISVLLFSLSLSAESKKFKVVVIGDSIAAGYGVAKKQAYPALLEELLLKKKKNVKVINAGIDGSTTASAPGRLKWQLRGKPDLIILELGGNDGLRGIKVQSSKENLDKAIKLAKDNDVKVLLAGMELPTNYGEKYRTEFREMFFKLAKNHKIELMPFLLKDVGAVREMNLPDGIHPNEKGHAIIAKNLLPFVEKFL